MLLLKAEKYTQTQRARFYRKAEKRLKKGHPFKSVLANKRRVEIRSELRSLHIAHCFLRGTPYRDIEQNNRSHPNWDRVLELVKEHGGRYFEDRNISAFDDMQLNWRPDFMEELKRIRKRSHEKKVRVRPSNRK
jgi:hypothetical protein